MKGNFILVNFWLGNNPMRIDCPCAINAKIPRVKAIKNLDNMATITLINAKMFHEWT